MAFDIRNSGLSQPLVLTMGRQIASFGVLLLLTVFIARSIGPLENGRYSLAMFLTTCLFTVFNLGLVAANAHFLGKKAVTLEAAFRETIRVSILLSLIGLFVGATLIVLFQDRLFPGVSSQLLWTALLSFPWALSQPLFSSLLLGTNEISKFNFSLILSPLCHLVLLSLCFVVTDLTGTIALGSYLASQIIGSISTFFFVYRIQAPARNSDSRYLPKAIHFGLKNHLSNMINFLNYRIDLVFINLFMGPAAVGIYFVAVQVAERLWIIAHSVATVEFPRLSHWHSSGDARRFSAGKSARIVFAMTIGGSLLVAIIARPFIVVVLGNEYEGAVSALLFLLPGICFGSLSKILANDLAARGKPEFNIFTAIVVSTTNIAANLWLIPRYGVAGAAVASSISYGLDASIKTGIYIRLSGRVL